MTKQTYFSKDFFVTASEKEALKKILAIPASVSHIKFLSENSVAPSWKFSYGLPTDAMLYHVDVSVLALTDVDTRVMLHIAHPNGAAFRKDRAIIAALHNFEAAIQAAMQGKLSSFMLQETKEASSNRSLQNTVSVAASLSLFFLLKKQS